MKILQSTARSGKIRPVLATVMSLWFAVLLSSCGVQVQASVGTDNSATIQMQSRIHPVLQAYLKDLATSVSHKTTINDKEIIDPEKIRQRLSQEKGVTIIKLETSLANGINLNLKIADLQQLFAAKTPDVKSVFTIKPENGQSRLTIRLDHKAVETFMSMGGAKDDAQIRGLLPQGGTITAAKYQEQLDWALEEYGSDIQRQEMFKNSVISIKLTVPRPIQSASGFTILNKAAGQVQLDISLLDILTLQKTLTFEVLY